MDPVQPVVLEPFLHQVGGSSSMLKVDQGTLCKPLVPREYLFYKNTSEEFKEFVPQYRGTIRVEVKEDSDGYVTLLGYPIPTTEQGQACSSDESNDSTYSPGSSGEWSSLKGGKTTDSDHEAGSAGQTSERYRFRLRKGGSIEIESEHSDIVKDLHEDPKKIKEMKGKKHNPWSLQIHRQALAKMQGGPDKICKFLLLEDVASKFAYPCILDFKMGTRQHGDTDNEQKRKNKIARCAKSTSSSLGFRFNGMQVFQANSGRYVCHNKYFGRDLKEDGLKSALYQFFHNGYKLRTDILEPIIDRLQKFHAMLSRQNTFRFYSSSLLLMYDGKERKLEPRKSGKTGDHVTAVKRSVSHEEIHAGDTTGAMYQSRSLERSRSLKRGSPDHERSRSPDRSVRSPTPIAIEKIDIRMIDFAHTTHKGCRDEKLHSGPDTGYMLGLENLIKLFQAFKAEHG